MYDRNRGWFCCPIQKTVRIDEYTFRVINSYPGRNFSDKLRLYVYDVEHGKKMDLNCNT